MLYMYQGVASRSVNTQVNTDVLIALRGETLLKLRDDSTIF